MLLAKPGQMKSKRESEQKYLTLCWWMIISVFPFPFLHLVQQASGDVHVLDKNITGNVKSGGGGDGDAHYFPEFSKNYKIRW